VLHPTAPHRHRRRVRLASNSLLLAAACWAGPALWASTIAVAAGEVVVAGNGVCSLREAIHNANTGGQVDNTDCSAGTAGLDTLELAAGSTYTLPDADSADPFTGLPEVTSEIVVTGNGATIERDASLTCTLDGVQVADEEFKLFHVRSGGSLTLGDLTLRNGCADGSKGTAKNGGAIVIKNGTLALDNVHVSGNRAYNLSGGLDTKNCTITITDSTFDDNYAGTGAGAIGNGDDCTLTLSHSVVAHNSAGAGGGIGNYGTLRIFDSTISDNIDLGTAPGGGGGGIGDIQGTVELVRSTVSGNTSAGEIGGGGVGLVGSTALIVNSTVSGNSATGDYGGGGILALAATVQLVASTVVGNSASGAAGGGGVSVQGFIELPPAGLEAKSSIVADNTTGGDCAGGGGATFAGVGVNYDSDGSCAAFDSAFSETSSAALHLGALASNGGPTQTIALLPGSVAIDTASDCMDLESAPLATDQRGVVRPIDGDGSGGAACDVGAYEAEPSVLEIPTLGGWALLLLGIALAGAGLAALRG